MTVKQRLEALKIPSPLEITGGRATTAAEWEKIKPLVREMMYKCEYGYIPEKPESVSCRIIETDDRFCAGKGMREDIEITARINGEDFTFPITYVYPVNAKKNKAFVCINFRPDVPDKYIPTEEIIDNGFAIASFCYESVTSDDNDFTNGLAGVIYKNEKRSLYSPGKIAMWAWAAMRVMDFLEMREEVDLDCVTVCGHSRLGKTALLTGISDERFACVHSNCAGCSGDSINRGKQEGTEKIGDIIRNFEFWFCENYKNYVGKDEETEFEQHFMHSLIAPRPVHIASAELDIWAGPEAQFLCCAAASEVYELYGKKGFVYDEDDFLKCGKMLNDGNIGLYFRHGRHYFARDDWHGLIDFINKRF